MHFAATNLQVLALPKIKLIAAALRFNDKIQFLQTVRFHIDSPVRIITANRCVYLKTAGQVWPGALKLLMIRGQDSIPWRSFSSRIRWTLSSRRAWVISPDSTAWVNASAADFRSLLYADFLQFRSMLIFVRSIPYRFAPPRRMDRKAAIVGSNRASGYW